MITIMQTVVMSHILVLVVALLPEMINSYFPPYTLDFDALQETRRVNMQSYDYDYNMNSIDRRTGLSIEEYHDVYDGKWPVIITDVVTKWPAMNWDKDFFIKHYGKTPVTMRTTSTGKLKDASGTVIELEKYLAHSHKGTDEMWSYLEDELFLYTRQDLLKDINSPVYLKEDFFMLFPEVLRPYNAMLLWGSPYSRSTIHMDPYNWTGTNAVLKGQKHWKLYLPGQDHLLDVKTKDKSGFPLNCKKYHSLIDAYDPDDVRANAQLNEAKVVEFVQYPGELLIIPTGWLHQAFNSEETVAISSQVMNLNNYKIILEEIFKAGNLPRSSMPTGFNEISPVEKVKTVMSLLPDDVIKKGEELTRIMLEQLKYVDRMQDEL